VNLRSTHTVTGVVTQGRPLGSQWVTSFQISYSMDGENFQYINDANGNKKVRKILLRKRQEQAMKVRKQ